MSKPYTSDKPTLQPFSKWLEEGPPNLFSWRGYIKFPGKKLWKNFGAGHPTILTIQKVIRVIQRAPRRCLQRGACSCSRHVKSPADNRPGSTLAFYVVRVETNCWCFRNPARKPADLLNITLFTESLYIPGGCLGFLTSTVVHRIGASTSLIIQVPSATPERTQ